MTIEVTDKIVEQIVPVDKGRKAMVLSEDKEKEYHLSLYDLKSNDDLPEKTLPFNDLKAWDIGLE